MRYSERGVRMNRNYPFLCAFYQYLIRKMLACTSFTLHNSLFMRDSGRSPVVELHWQCYTIAYKTPHLTTRKCRHLLGKPQGFYLL